MLAQGATLHDVMKALGHANIAETANTYGHLVEGRSRELADEMDRLLGRGAGWRDAAVVAAVAARAQ